MISKKKLFDLLGCGVIVKNKTSGFERVALLVDDGPRIKPPLEITELALKKGHEHLKANGPYVTVYYPQTRVLMNVLLEEIVVLSPIRQLKAGNIFHNTIFTSGVLDKCLTGDDFD